MGFTPLAGLAFTAGVGENAPLLRTRVAERFAFLEMRLDESSNGKSPANASG